MDADERGFKMFLFTCFSIVQNSEIDEAACPQCGGNADNTACRDEGSPGEWTRPLKPVWMPIVNLGETGGAATSCAAFVREDRRHTSAHPPSGPAHAVTANRVPHDTPP